MRAKRKPEKSIKLLKIRKREIKSSRQGKRVVGITVAVEKAIKKSSTVLDKNGGGFVSFDIKKNEGVGGQKTLTGR